MALDAGNKIINTNTGLVAEGKDISGGYFSIDALANIPTYSNIVGALCYVTSGADAGKFFKYNGTIWEEALGGTVADVKVDGTSVLDSEGVAQIDLATPLSTKQNTLVSGSNIKTINNSTILGSGNLNIDSLPSQTGKSGKYLKTNGTAASWEPTLQVDATFGSDDKLIFNGDVGGVSVVQTTGTSINDIMSQNAVTDAISKNGMNNVVFPPDMIFNDMSSGADVVTCTSVNRYLLSETANIAVFDFKLTCGNIYTTAELLSIKADNNNYLSFGISAYNVYFRLAINGTLDKNIIISSGTGTYWQELSYARTSWVEFDFILKQIRIRAKLQDSTIKTCLTQDISDWDLSALTEFNIVTSVSSYYTGKVSVKNIRINNNISQEYMSNRTLTIGNYIALDTLTPVNTGGSIDGDDVYLLIGGTIQETISNKHKITLANNPTYSYFGCGACSSIHTYKRNINTIIKAKFTNLSDNFLVGPSGPCTEMLIIDPDNGETVADWSRRLGGDVYGESLRNGWKPTADKWYIFYQRCDNTLSYTSSYSWYLQGSATIEVIAIGCAYSSAMNLCAQNYNGSYFTGNTPFTTSYVPYFVQPNWDNINYPVNQAIKIQSTGNIFMYNGTVWKQLNNN